MNTQGRQKGALGRKTERSESHLKKINQQLREQGLRKCRECEDIKDLEQFRVIKWQVTAATKHLSYDKRIKQATYSNTCKFCEGMKAVREAREQITKDLL